MYANKFLKLLYSLPIILITLYYIPFLGIFLILFRMFMNDSKKNYIFHISLVICGILILFPHGIKELCKSLKINSSYIEAITNSDVYPSLIKYSKRLIIVGVVFLIMTYVLKNVFSKISNKLRENIHKAYNDSLENDYKAKVEAHERIQKQKESIKNYRVVKCSNCGAENTISEAGETCKYCRTKLK